LNPPAKTFRSLPTILLRGNGVVYGLWQTGKQGVRHESEGTTRLFKKTQCTLASCKFGTELVTASDGSIVAMPGASPGASTAVSIMVEVIKRCFRDKLTSKRWANKLKEMIPSYGQSLIENSALAMRLKAETAAILKINDIATKGKKNDSRVPALHGA
jgi:hypothetical protein